MLTFVVTAAVVLAFAVGAEVNRRERIARSRALAARGLGAWAHAADVLGLYLSEDDTPEAKAIRALKRWVVAQDEPDWPVFELNVARVLRGEITVTTSPDGRSRPLTASETVRRAVRSADRMAERKRAGWVCETHGMVRPEVVRMETGFDGLRCPRCGGKATTLVWQGPPTTLKAGPYAETQIPPPSVVGGWLNAEGGHEHRALLWRRFDEGHFEVRCPDHGEVHLLPGGLCPACSRPLVMRLRDNPAAHRVSTTKPFRDAIRWAAEAGFAIDDPSGSLYHPPYNEDVFPHLDLDEGSG